MKPADVLALHEECYIAECREYSIRDSVDDAISTSVPCPIKTMLHGGAMWFTSDSLAAALEKAIPASHLAGDPREDAANIIKAAKEASDE